MNFDSLKQQCFEANLQLPRLELVIYTFGNASCVDRSAGVYAIKPTGVPYHKMRWQDMVVVDFDGKVVEGRKPSSDDEVHRTLYREFPAVGGIVHTHSTFATSWAQARCDVPVYGSTHADHQSCAIPCIDMAAADPGMKIVEYFKAHKFSPAKVTMFLAAGHGPFALGKDGASAVYNARVMEEICKMAFLTRQINPAVAAMK